MQIYIYFFKTTFWLWVPNILKRESGGNPGLKILTTTPDFISHDKVILSPTLCKCLRIRNFVQSDAEERVV